MNTEKNILIAEFMGRKFQAFCENISYNKEFDTYSDCQSFIDTLSEKGYIPEIGWNMGCGLYHESWDWLMPVVEKIEIENDIYSNQPMYDSRDEFKGWTCTWFTLMPKDEILGHLDTLRFPTKIEAVYNAVVEFITWYNKQPKK